MGEHRSPARRSRLREAGIGFAMTVASVVLALLAAEIGLRLASGRADLWELHNYVDKPPLLDGRSRSMTPDPVLGYVPTPGYTGTDHGGVPLTFDHRGLRAHRLRQPPPLSAKPILVVGNSFAMGMEVADDETWPAHLEALLNRPVLNGGVQGYGVDQMVLRAERLVPIHRPDELLVSVIADDVDRAESRIMWGVEKPYFDIVNGELVLRNVPIKPPEQPDASLDPVRRILGYSFLIKWTMDRLGLHTYWHRGLLPRSRVHDQGDRVGCLLMDRLKKLGRAHDMGITIIAQYSVDVWSVETAHDYERRVITSLLACAREAGIDTLDTYAALAAAVQADGVSSYYLEQHLNGRGNRLTAELIARHLQE